LSANRLGIGANGTPYPVAAGSDRDYSVTECQSLSRSPISQFLSIARICPSEALSEPPILSSSRAALLYTPNVFYGSVSELIRTSHPSGSRPEEMLLPRPLAHIEPQKTFGSRPCPAVSLQSRGCRPPRRSRFQPRYGSRPGRINVLLHSRAGATAANRSPGYEPTATPAWRRSLNFTQRASSRQMASGLS
jgi:hypothetical protein